MAKQIYLENAKVSFSTMLNRPEKAMYGRCFKVLLSMDSPEYKTIVDQYAELSTKAQKHFTEANGKPCKKAKSVDDVFPESIYSPGFVELGFSVAKVEEVSEEGSEVKNYKETYLPLYRNSNGLNCYYIGNNGEQVSTLGEKQIVPRTGNMIDLSMSFCASYNSKDNKPSIKLRADEIVILNPELGKGEMKSLGFITLDDDDEAVAKKVETVQPKKEEELFTEDDISDLDLANV